MISVIKILKSLFRPKPVMAWTVTTFVLIMSAGIHDGLIPNYWLAFVSMLVPLLLQGIVSHAINDIVDEDVDRDTDIKNTKRIKVLVSGLSSKADLWVLSLLSIMVCVVLGIYLYTIRGNVILLILASGIFMIYAYNYKPFKLNYRPFAEYSVVIPVILLISVGFSYSIFGKMSESIIIVSIINAIMNVSWYYFSRMQDVVPDCAHGKMTTFAMMLKKSNGDFIRFYRSSTSYISWSLVALIICMIALSYYMINGLISVLLLWVFGGNVSYFMLSGSFKDFYNISITSAHLRSFGMHITYINCILLSISLLIYK